MSLTDVLLVGGIGFVAYQYYTNPGIANALGGVLGLAESVVGAAVPVVERVIGAVEPVAQFLGTGVDVLTGGYEFRDVGAGTIPELRSEPVFDQGWDGLRWRGLGGGQVRSTCGGRTKIDGLCYNACPTGFVREIGLPYLCSLKR